MLGACRWIEHPGEASVMKQLIQDRTNPTGMPVIDRSDTTSPLLSVADVDTFYGPVQSLYGVTIDVKPGETLALLGTNGAGKSTLLKAISGLIPVARGSVTFDGVDVTHRPVHQRVNSGVVLVRGGVGVFPTLTVRDNLQLGGYTLGRRKRQLANRIDHVVDIFPVLGDRMSQHAGTLSGGEQQMVALAKAMLLEPKLLIIDELSLGLAPLVIDRLLQVIDELKRGALTMIIVEQSLNVALAFADRAVFMERGQVCFTGDPTELAANGDLVRAIFFGQRTES
jgi:ABC-type branched-subunit amino acid transport system ATPase component